MFRHVTKLLNCSFRYPKPGITKHTVASSSFKRPMLRPISSDHDNLIKNLLSPNRPLSVTEWSELRTKLLSADGSINEVNIDASILGRCLSGGQLDVGKSYMQFLQDIGITPNLATIGRMLRLYHASKTKITDEDQVEIIKICNELLSKSSTYDSNTCENMLHALSMTSEWRRSLSLLDTIKLTANPSVSAYSTLISRAFAEKDEVLAWKILNECVSLDKIPRCEAFVSYIKMCSDVHSSTGVMLADAINKMLQFIGHHDIMITQMVIDELKNFYLALGANCSEVVIKENGDCSNCMNKLRSVYLTKNEFKELSSKFLDRVLVRKDVFLKTSPEEVTKFEQFLRHNHQFHCVIDGLNVALTTGSKNNNVQAKLLSSVVRYFVERNKRVLVLGRKHMHKWPKSQMSYVENNAKMFLVDDLSQDDPFLLYATLKCGPSTDFVSRDLMRGHAHLLGPETKTIFRRWQQEHQFCIQPGSHPGFIDMQKPLKYQTTAHSVNGHWHIPYTYEYMQAPPDSHTMPPRWLCVLPSK